MGQIIFYICFLYVFLSGCTSAHTSSVNAVERFMNEGMVPAVFIAVIRGDSVIFEKSLGVSDKDAGILMSQRTCMELGSVSKAFTAEMIFLLHRQQLLNIEDPVQMYFPDAPASWSSITIRHLLEHTSGIQNYLLDPRFYAGPYFQDSQDTTTINFFNSITQNSMVQKFYSLPIEFAAGQTWSYSNTGYYLLGKIAEKVTGNNFFELVSDKVLAPIGMHYTQANEIAAIENCLAKGYLIKNGIQIKHSKVLSGRYAFSAGAWATNGLDLIKYIKRIHKKILPSDSAGYDWRNIPAESSLPFSYHGGRFYSTFHGMKILSHNGGTAGFSSSWIYVPDKSISVILLLNRQDYSATDQLAWDVLSLFESSLKYPIRKLSGEEENRNIKMLEKIIKSIQGDTKYPDGLALPLRLFLESENGKGLWKWYFERGFPKSIICVDKEVAGIQKIYRFRLRFSESVEYRLSTVVNDKDEVVQIRWW